MRLVNPHIACKLLSVKKIGNLTYTMGLVRCTHCAEFFSCPDLVCPCCGYKLKRHPRQVNQKAIYQKNGITRKPTKPRYPPNFDFQKIRDDLFTQILTLKKFRSKIQTEQNKKKFAFRSFWYNVNLPEQKRQVKIRLRRYQSAEHKRHYRAKSLSGFRAFLKRFENDDK